MTLNGRPVAKVLLTPTNAYIVPAGHPLAATWREPAQPAAAYRARATVTVLDNGRTGRHADLAIPSGCVPICGPVVACGGLALAILVMIVVAALAASSCPFGTVGLALRRFLGTRDWDEMIEGLHLESDARAAKSQLHASGSGTFGIARAQRS